MKNSKFLKKSIAIVLSAMLVIAMIPVSAFAAVVPQLSEFKVTDGNTATIDQTGKKVSLSITSSEEADGITGDLDATYIAKDGNGDLRYVDSDGGFVAYDGKLSLDEEYFEYSETDSTYTGDMVVYMTSSNYTLYTFVITVTPDNGDASMKEFKVANQIKSEIKTSQIIVDMPFGDPEMEIVIDDDVEFRVGANEEKGNGDAVIDNSDAAYGDGDKIVVIAKNGNKKTYTLKLNVPDAIETFTIKDQVNNPPEEDEFEQPDYDYDMDDNLVGDDGLITLYLEYGKDVDEKGNPIKKYDITPSYKLGTAGATIKLHMGDTVTTLQGSGRTTVNIADTTDGGFRDDLSIEVTYLNGKRQAYYDLVIECLEDNFEAAITGAQAFSLGSEIYEEIKWTGTTKFEAELGLNADLTQVGLRITGSKGAHVYVVNQMDDADDGIELGTGVDGEDILALFNASKAVTLRVVSERNFANGDKTKGTDYTFTAKKAAKQSEPQINTLWVRDADDNIYNATVKNNTDPRTIELNIPYMMTNDELEDCFLSFTKTTSTEIRLENGDPVTFAGDKVPAGFFPDVDAKKDSPESKTEVTVVGDGGEDHYVVTVKKETAKTSRTMKSASVSTKSKELEKDTTYVGKAGKRDVELDAEDEKRSLSNFGFALPYSVYNNKNNKYDEGLFSVVSVDAGATAFILVNGDYVSVVNPTDDVEGSPAIIDFKDYDFTQKDIDFGLPVMVLNEKATYTEKITGTQYDPETGVITVPQADMEEYLAKPLNATPYEFYPTELPAKDGNKLSSMTFDSNVKVVVTNSVVNGNKINIEIPWSYIASNKDGLAIDLPEDKFYPTFDMSPMAGLFLGEDDETDVEILSGGLRKADGTLDPDSPFIGFDYDLDDKAQMYLVEADGTVIDELPKLWCISEGGDSNMYDVKVTVKTANTSANMSKLSLDNYVGVAGANKTFTVSVPFATQSLVFNTTFTVSPMAYVLFNGDLIESGDANIDYTNPIDLTVYSENGKSHYDYTVSLKFGERFTDVKSSDWFYNAVNEAAELGIVSGIGDGTFLPKKNVTRAEFAVMAAHLFVTETELQAMELPNPFTDIPSNAWYTKAVLYCKEQGYISGDVEGTYRPGDAISRQEMAIIMCNIMDLVQVTSPEEKFADDAKIADWAKGSVYACKEAELISGKDNNMFDPIGKTIRAEAAVVMVNMYHAK